MGPGSRARGALTSSRSRPVCFAPSHRKVPLVAHSALALTRAGVGAAWQGAEVDLAEVEDLDGATDLLREGGATGALFVEEDDEWFGVVRVEGDDDARVFLSDRRVLETSDLAGRLFADALPPVLPGDDDDESSRPEIEPAGDADLLADLGTSGGRVMELTAEEGLLPGDVIAALVESAGGTDVVEALRGA